MIKKIVVVLTLLGSTAICKASDPTAIPVGTQIQLSLLSHVTAVEEQTSHGQLKSAFLDGICEFGHYNGDYLAAIDAGTVNSTAPDSFGNLEGTIGFHVHVLSALAAALPLSPSLSSAIQLLELNPRWSYDADVHHGVLAVTFGARIPFQ